MIDPPRIVGVLVAGLKGAREGLPPRPRPHGEAAAAASWDAFNEVLASQHLTWLSAERIDHREQSRLEVWLDGQQVPHDRLVRTTTSMSNVATLRLDDQELRRLVADGATMVVRSAHEMDGQLGDLSERLGWWAAAPVVASLVADCTGRATLRSHTGPGQHRLVVQLAGHQHVAVDGVATSSRWCGTLAEGHVVAVPGDSTVHTVGQARQPSLHLELDVFDASPSDVADHLVSQVADAEIVRAAVPRFAESGERDAWVVALRERVLAELDDEFLQRTRVARAAALTPQRMTFSLPSSGTAEVLPKQGDVRVRWTAPHPQQGDRSLMVGGSSFRVDPGHQQLLEPLFSGEPIAVADLHPAGLAHVPTRELLVSWVLLGHVAVVDGCPGQEAPDGR